MTANKQHSPHFWSPDIKTQKASQFFSLFILLFMVFLKESKEKFKMVLELIS